MKAFPICILIMITLMSVAASALADNPVKVEVNAAKQISTVPDLYNVGYNGWGDITYPSAIKHLNGVNVKYCRIIAQLKEMCGDKPGDYRWEYVTPPDMGLGFITRVKKLIANGWTPIIAFSLHGGYSDLPKWFHGENNDNNSKAWFRYNTDGSLDPDGKGNQYEALTRITHDTVAKLASEGLKGLYWETIYEMGADMPLPDIHYYAAKGIREGDPSSKIVGPATWPGWTVEEKFVKPYLAQHGSDLLDYVSLHWYGSNDHELWDLGFKPDSDIITMADRKYVDYLMSMTPKFAKWTQSLRTLLDDRKVNTSGKHIGIMYTEFDVIAQSPFQKNPENPDWPKYNPAADCYINTNYYGGVWCASVLCSLAANGKADIVCKFNTRSYYGLIENGVDKNYFRQPVWFAWKLLQQRAGLIPGAKMFSTNVQSSTNAHQMEAYTVGNKGKLRVILINKSFESCKTNLLISNMIKGKWKITRYIYDADRTAKFIGRKPGSSTEGTFEGAPADDSKNATSLKPVDTFTARCDGSRLTLPDITCPPVSISVLVLERG